MHLHDSACWGFLPVRGRVIFRPTDGPHGARPSFAEGHPAGSCGALLDAAAVSLCVFASAWTCVFVSGNGIAAVTPGFTTRGAFSRFPKQPHQGQAKHEARRSSHPHCYHLTSPFWPSGACERAGSSSDVEDPLGDSAWQGPLRDRTGSSHSPRLYLGPLVATPSSLPPSL